MAKNSRANVISSFTLIRGALIQETYAVLARWDLSLSKTDNLRLLKEGHWVAAQSANWLRDFAFVISRRLDMGGRDRVLAVLARSGCTMEIWCPILLWHITRDEFLLRDFLMNWLYPEFESGVYRIRTEDLKAYLRSLPSRGGVVEHAWAESTIRSVAQGLLKIAVDFGILKGSLNKEFATYHLPEASFLYVLHALVDSHMNPRKVIEASDWRMYMMRPAEVEREILRLHQFRKLEYQVAGSLAQLTLPYKSAIEYAERLAA